jgi:hypothetical protein
MRLDETEKARATHAVTEGIGNAGFGLQVLTILKLQMRCDLTPSQIFENRKRGRALARETRLFAFCPLIAPSDNFVLRLCSPAPDCARNAKRAIAILRG